MVLANGPNCAASRMLHWCESHLFLGEGSVPTKLPLWWLENSTCFLAKSWKGGNRMVRRGRSWVWILKVGAWTRADVYNSDREAARSVHTKWWLLHKATQHFCGVSLCWSRYWSYSLVIKQDLCMHGAAMLSWSASDAPPLVLYLVQYLVRSISWCKAVSAPVYI